MYVRLAKLYMKHISRLVPGARCRRLRRSAFSARRSISSGVAAHINIYIYIIYIYMYVCMLWIHVRDGY